MNSSCAGSAVKKSNRLKEDCLSAIACLVIFIEIKYEP